MDGLGAQGVEAEPQPAGDEQRQGQRQGAIERAINVLLIGACQPEQAPAEGPAHAEDLAVGLERGTAPAHSSRQERRRLQQRHDGVPAQVVVQVHRLMIGEQEAGRRPQAASPDPEDQPTLDPGARPSRSRPGQPGGGTSPGTQQSQGNDSRRRHIPPNAYHDQAARGEQLDWNQKEGQ